MRSNNKSLNVDTIPFNTPFKGEKEKEYVLQALESNQRQGGGEFTRRVIALLKQLTGANKILLTHSCTGALELAMLLMGIQSGDEVILPSFTFSSTANAVALRGGVPIFADVDPNTQCINVSSVAKLITARTRLLIPVHYAGVSCDMNAILELAQKHSLKVVEDAAQAIGATMKGQALGTFGDLGALSFHDTKNISAGEGGALLINNPQLIERAEILLEKGTNRSQYIQGMVDKYTWVDLGSSFIMSEISAAHLLGQLEELEEINQNKLRLWQNYFEAFAQLEYDRKCQRPYIPIDCKHNAHIFYLILPTESMRNNLLAELKQNNIIATFHYVPLHDSPAGLRFGRAPLPLPNTYKAGHCLIRLPLFPDMTSAQQEKIIRITKHFLMTYDMVYEKVSESIPV